MNEEFLQTEKVHLRIQDDTCTVLTHIQQEASDSCILHKVGFTEKGKIAYEVLREGEEFKSTVLLTKQLSDVTGLQYYECSKLHPTKHLAKSDAAF